MLSNDDDGYMAGNEFNERYQLSICFRRVNGKMLITTVH